MQLSVLSVLLLLCRLILLILARPTFGPNPFVSSFLSKICQFPSKIDILSFVSSLHSLVSKNVHVGGIPSDLTAFPVAFLL
jgi:hypothetical protein